MAHPETDRDLLPVAQIVKSYNTTGEVVLKLTGSLLEDYNTKEPVFIYFDELPVPFFIETFRTRGTSGAIVKFGTVNDLRHSEELVKKEIFIPAASLDEESLQDASREDMGAFLKGVKVFDQHNVRAGVISGYFDYPNNPCIEITAEDPEKEPYLVPFNEELVIKFDARKKILRLHIPAGLSDL